jgi:tRNA threonylcarbamoyladenosine biosynthesis protein TsaB
MTVILALETSTQTCSVALLCEREGEITVFHRSVDGQSGHAQNIFPLIDEVLEQAKTEKRELNVIAFGQGPGAFTGLRLACGVAQGLALALGLDLIPIGTLQAVANAAQPEAGEIIVAALDARMDEMYLAVYVANNRGEMTEICSPILLQASDASLFIKQRINYWIDALKPLGIEYSGHASLIGEGWRLVDLPSLQDLLSSHVRLVNQTELPDARQLARLALQRWKIAGGIAPEEATPLYLRDKVAFTTLERAAGEGGNPKAASLILPEKNASSGMSLVPMSGSDLKEVFALECSVQSFPWTLKNFEDALNAHYDAWVLRNEFGVKGFCVAMGAPDLFHILVIAVAKDVQRQGHARTLLSHVAALAKSRGAEGLLLEVRPSNKVACEFYEKAGFEQIGVRRNYYPAGRGQREDALIMKQIFKPDRA